MNERWIVSTTDYRKVARRRLPHMIFDYLEGGALDEITTRANKTDLDQLLLRQRNFVDLTGMATHATVLAQKVDMPLLVSPMGMLTMFNPASDIAVAKAAADAGSIYVHSAWAGCSIEDVLEVGRERVWAQVAFWKDDAESAAYVDRLEACGVNTLVIAGDVNSSSKRERDLRHGLTMPPRPPALDYLRTGTRPRWIWGWRTGRPMSYGNYSIDGRPMKMHEMNDWMAKNKNRSATWEDVRKLRSRWPGKLVLKGVMDAEDAKLAADAGVDAVYVSNHGGRQFDAQRSAIAVLPSVADAVSGRVEIYMDGGICRGHDIVKAMACGADAVFAGRTFAYALAAGGESAVAKTFAMLQDELVGAMGFVGVTAPSQIDRSVLV